jgi:Putative addiction module component
VITLPLKQMSRAEKLMALEALWEELSRDETEYESPAWHEEELAATERRVENGKEQFIVWEKAKTQLRN